MSPSRPQPQKFWFDTAFDESGTVVSHGVSAKRPKRVYTAAEVEVLRQKAFAEGQAAQAASDDGVRARALAEIADSLRQALPGLAHVARLHREASAGLALAVGRALAGAALDLNPQAVLTSALRQLEGEIGTEARVVVRSGPLDEAGRAAVEKACADAGLAQALVLREEPGLAPAAFVIEWPDGRADFDLEAAMARVREALEAALAADGDHGDRIPTGETR